MPSPLVEEGVLAPVSKPPATTTSGGTTISSSPASLASAKCWARTSSPAAGSRPAYATTTPPWPVSTPGTAWRASSVSTTWAPIGWAKRSTVSTPRPASRAISEVSGGHSGRGTSTSGTVLSVSQRATTRVWPTRRIPEARRRSEARSAVVHRTDFQPRPMSAVPAMVVNVAPAGARSAADASSPMTRRGAGEVKPSRG